MFKTTGRISAQSPDITIEHMYSFLLKDYWSRVQYCIQFYSNVCARNHFFRILAFFHFENNEYPSNYEDTNYDRLWKIRKFVTLNSKLCEMYNPTEHLTLDEVIVLYKGRLWIGIIFQSNIKYWHQIFKLCDSGLHLYELVFRQWQYATAEITAIHGSLL
jgi:hypothetical protein